MLASNKSGVKVEHDRFTMTVLVHFSISGVDEKRGDKVHTKIVWKSSYSTIFYVFHRMICDVSGHTSTYHTATK